MKIYIVSFRSLIKYLSWFLLAALLISAASITGMDVLGAFSSDKELPIYCVETDEKIASLTFDCAWGEGTKGYRAKAAKIVEQQAAGS